MWLKIDNDADPAVDELRSGLLALLKRVKISDERERNLEYIRLAVQKRHQAIVQFFLSNARYATELFNLLERARVLFCCQRRASSHGSS